MKKKADTEVICEIIPANGDFPNNPILPLLLYKKCLEDDSADAIEALFLSNGWKNTWRDSIYPFHHYHSNTHEVLGISCGKCTVQIGGDDGKIFEIEKGDVIIFPAGTSHRNLSCSNNFQTIGAYPFETPYDMCYGKKEELSFAIDNIKKAPLPKTDPVFGKEGPLLEYWHVSK